MLVVQKIEANLTKQTFSAISYSLGDHDKFLTQLWQTFNRIKNIRAKPD